MVIELSAHGEDFLLRGLVPPIEGLLGSNRIFQFREILATDKATVKIACVTGPCNIVRLAHVLRFLTIRKTE
jgi:hypothetical protein